MHILYPLFVYSYLDTIKQNIQWVAADLMREFKPRFIEVDGVSVSVAKELEDLATVKFPQQLQNPLPKEVRLFAAAPAAEAATPCWYERR